ncbi:MAG: hypothetical protein L0K86_15955 [Actinomycetia bacterium]|nr:hypothetical protein [Actinomycetes bacterium]
MTEDQAAFTVPNRAANRTYRRKRKRLTLAFDGHPTLDGLEIVCRSVSLGAVLELQARFVAYQRAESGSTEEAHQLEELLTRFAGMVQSWNYTDEDEAGQLVEVGFSWQMLRDEFDYDETMTILNAHTRAVQGVSDPLSQTSGDGQPSVEAQIPMDVASSSQAS